MRKKELLVYDPSVHNYSEDKPVWEEISTGFYLLVWAWFQYLAFDGFHPLKDIIWERNEDTHSPGTAFGLKDLLNQRIDAFSELDEEEQTVVKLCADLIVGTVFLIVSLL